MRRVVSRVRPELRTRPLRPLLRPGKSGVPLLLAQQLPTLRVPAAAEPHAALLVHAHAERAAKNAVTASKISKYYLAGQVNPDVETLLTCNNIYCHSSKDKLKGGEGGGYLALLEVAINTALKNRDAKKERETQAARIQEQQAKDAAIQRRVMLEQEKMPPNIDWHSSWVHRFRGTINRENIRDKGVSVAFSQDTKVSHYYFTIDNQTYQGEIRCYAQDRSGRWCNYSDTFGNGKALVKVLNTTGVIINFINEIGGGQGQVVGNITATP